MGNTQWSILVAPGPPVHPHTRGEHGIALPGRLFVNGSSPHTWGTRGREAFREPPRSVHPHTRGEHEFRLRAERIVYGSSPHTWGTRQSSVPWLRSQWFIPTHVGNTNLPFCRLPRQSVHPHTRGEHEESIIDCKVSNGSSPHTWGTRLPPPQNRGFCRFIPTHVGNTQSVRPLLGLLSVHPHTRGEHVRNVTFVTRIYGSSPHTWGTHNFQVLFLSHYRFIPTHVGNTQAPPRIETRIPVHPHTRGEHSTPTLSVSDSTGSSPHTWGTLFSLSPVAGTFLPNTPEQPDRGTTR